MTEIGEITVGTLLKRVIGEERPCINNGKIYQVVEVSKSWGVKILDNFERTWTITTGLYEIVGHVDENIIQELDQMLEFFLKYNELESYIVNNA